jgi:WD40 repeat protein
MARFRLPRRSRPSTAPRSSTQPGEPTYNAFISYSHAVDGKLAPTLQSALHGFARPWNRLRALRVFRDEASLSANPALWASIERALHASPFFILLASPEAARSRWVDREIAYWLQHKPRANFLLALTDGEAVWDEAVGDFDWDRTTAVPRSLEGVFEEEPRYIDLRWARLSEDISLHNSRFRDAIADLAAPLHGRAKDELIGEDVRQHHRTVRLTRAAITVVVTFALLAAGSTVLTLRQLDQTRRARNEAEARARVATSRLLARVATDDLNDRPALALLESLKGFQTADTSDSRNALAEALQRVPRLAAVFPGESQATAVAVSPMGSILALGTSDGSIALWDPLRRQPTGLLAAPGGGVQSLAFSSDGSTLAADIANGPVIIWDVRSRRQIHSIPVGAGDATVAFSLKERGVLIATDGGDIALWRLGQKDAEWIVKTPFAGLDDAAYSPDGRLIAVAAEEAALLDPDSGMAASLNRQKRMANVSCVAFSPDGKLLAVGDFEGAITLWDVHRRKELGVLARHVRGVTSVAFSPNGRILASGGEDGTTRVWDVARKTVIGKPLALAGKESPENPVSSVAFVTDDLLVAATYDGMGLLWRVREKPSLNVAVKAPSRIVRSIAVSPDKKTFATGSDEGGVSVLWNTQRRTPITEFAYRRSGQRLNSETFVSGTISFSPDGSALLAGGNGDSDSPALLWSIPNRRLRGVLDSSIGVMDAVFMSGGQRILAIQQESLVVWDTQNLKVIHTIRAPCPPVSLALNPQTGILALGCDLGPVILFDLEKNREISTLRGHAGTVQSLTFSPDGRTLASAGSDTGVILWDVRQHSRIATLSGHSKLVFSLAFRPDGRQLASAGADGNVIIWDIASKELLGRLKAEGSVLSVQYLNPETLISGNFDATVRFWNLSAKAWEQQACEIVGPLTTSERFRSLLQAGAPNCK